MSVFSIFYALISLGQPTHDIAMAKFRLYPSEEGLKMTIMINVDDLKNEMDVAEFSMENLQTYFEQHMIYTFEGRKEVFKLCDFSFDRDHLIVQTTFLNRGFGMKRIEIQNTCLVNVRGHSNMIEITANEEQKDFRMHKNRTKIEVNFD